MKKFVHILIQCMNKFAVWFILFQIEEKHDTEWLQAEGIDSDGDLETDPDEWELFPSIKNTVAYEYIEVILFKKTTSLHLENSKRY